MVSPSKGSVSDLSSIRVARFAWFAARFTLLLAVDVLPLAEPPRALVSDNVINPRIITSADNKFSILLNLLIIRLPETKVRAGIHFLAEVKQLLLLLCLVKTILIRLASRYLSAESNRRTTHIYYFLPSASRIQTLYSSKPQNGEHEFSARNEVTRFSGQTRDALSGMHNKFAIMAPIC